VDPVAGSDSIGSGYGTVPGCAFRTVTRALQVVGAPTAPVEVELRGPSTVGAGESFPFALVENVTLTTSGGPVQVEVPNAQVGVLLASGASGIAAIPAAALTLDGQNHEGCSGIVATTGSQRTTRVTGVTVTSFLGDGIVVESSGVLSIGPGVTSTLNGTATEPRAGLHVAGTGQALVSVPAGSAPTHFDANTSHGILVEEEASIAVSGAVTDPALGVGTVTTNANDEAGVWVAQTPGRGPQNVITGLVSFGSPSGNGLRFVAGSSVKLRGSASLGNRGSGVLVTDTSASSDISQIDLGRTGDSGDNLLQAAEGGTASNASAGICLQVNANAGMLRAVGNVFSAANCAMGTGALTMTTQGCGARCAGAECDLAVMGRGNDIDVSSCSHP
jgi:hypothetical protein